MLPARRRHLSDAWQAVLAVVLSSVFLLGIATHYSIIPRMRRPGLRKGKPDYGTSAPHRAPGCGSHR